MGVEPVPDSPAAVATTGEERCLVVADYHAGIERGLRREGVELASDADVRRARLLDLLAETAPDRLVVLGDLAHSIGDPAGAEREEVTALLDAVEVPVTVVRGNHDGGIDELCADAATPVTVTPSDGVRIGSVGFAHGHTWPSRAVLGADVICVGHEHPVVRLEDEVGGRRVERAWLRGRVDPAPFESQSDGALGIDADLVVCPAFNDRSGGTWVNVAGQEFLSPFLPAGLADGEAYLLDGTRLGRYRSI
ncbi:MULTISPECIES: metallophosphoesterase [Halomicrobium]|uniref:Metallophosphoesterase n=2 Tax=Halomicrobium mukohataei TaxID=57705 RepID=C7NY70_HALMD|nr:MULTISPECIES: metallophosphoesterase [Halomicrobium]ACV48530.1 metallophosphoesterase [Halomicrobium mukohataei DSM 12286]QCD66931.1 metallophosphoesterase [Halomicrobium mukohataei]QFR21741.1 phosphoesterase [Halomicrobium sp. ZPS1]